MYLVVACKTSYWYIVYTLSITIYECISNMVMCMSKLSGIYIIYRE